MEPATDLAEQASQLLSTWGPVHAGTSAGDFETIELTGEPVSGWVVTGHHSDVLNYVFPRDAQQSGPGSWRVGLLGRTNRDSDASSLRIVHVEDNRA